MFLQGKGINFRIVITLARARVRYPGYLACALPYGEVAYYGMSTS